MSTSRCSHDSLAALQMMYMKSTIVLILWQMQTIGNSGVECFVQVYTNSSRATEAGREIHWIWKLKDDKCSLGQYVTYVCAATKLSSELREMRRFKQSDGLLSIFIFYTARPKSVRFCVSAR